MIPANELRVGNRVMLGGVDIKITADFLYFEKNLNDACRRIPLTSEILTEWCGAEKINDETYRIESEYFELMSDGIHWQQSDDRLIKLPFLHSLQNLFFALTGTELELTPPVSTPGE